MEKAAKKSNYGFINGELPYLNSNNYGYCIKLKEIANKVLDIVFIEDSLRYDKIYMGNISRAFNDPIEDIEKDFNAVYRYSGKGFAFREFMALLFSALYKIESGIVVDSATNSIVEDVKWYNFIPIDHIESEIELMILFHIIDQEIVDAKHGIEISNLHSLAAHTLTDLDNALEDMEILFNSEVVLTVLIQEIISHLELASKSK